MQPKQKKSNAPKRNNQRKQKNPKRSQPIDITQGATVTGKEPLLTVTLTKGATTSSFIKPFLISTASPIIKKYYEIYDSYKIKSMSYRFVTDEASTRSGNASLGLDYGTPPTSITRESVGKLTPRYSGPIKNNSPWITISPKFFNTNVVRFSSDTTAPFNLCAIFTAESDPNSDRVIGVVEVKYVIEFLGLKP